MAVANLTYPRFKAFKAGQVLSGGKVYVYEAGTTTKTTIWQDQNKNSTHSNPVTLDSNGEAEIWFEGPVKVVLEDSSGTQQWTIDDVQSDIPPSDVGRFNVLENGSFELDANGDNLPDDWTITEDDSTSTVEIDTTNVSHGANSLKFVSQGSGGGTATTAQFFEVNAGKTCVVAFTIKSSVADVRNQVQVRYFDKDQTFISAETVYDENTTNPTSFEEKRFVSSVPATATFGKLRLIGCDPSDPTSGTTYFDDIKVFTDQQAAVYSTDTTNWKFSGTGGDVTASASGLNSAGNATHPITTEGDLIVGDNSGVESRLAIGSANTVLRSNGTTASYGKVQNDDLASGIKFDVQSSQSASGSTVTFTGLPSGARRITMIWDSISLDASPADMGVRLGDSGGVESSGYASVSAFIEGGGNSVDTLTSGFKVESSAAGSTYSGIMTLVHTGSNRWIASHTMRASDPATISGGGHKTLSAELDRVQAFTSANFDNGTFDVIVEID